MVLYLFDLSIVKCSVCNITLFFFGIVLMSY